MRRIDRIRALAAATTVLAATLAGDSRAESNKPASYFVDGKSNPALLGAVRRSTNPTIDFNGRFSSAEVSCGPGCGSYWFVDRRTGGVIEAPASPAEDQMIWAVRSQPTSDTIAVMYGPSDGVAGRCVARHFRLAGKSFVALDKPAPAKCPS